MGRLIVLMGPTGAGKSIQAEALAAVGWSHISSGDLLRRDPAVAAVLARGELAPSPEVEQLVSGAVSAVPDATPVVLDGFPRTIDEADWLEHQLPAWGRTLDGVMLLEVSAATTAARVAGRGRGDDNSAAVAEKQTEYASQTAPVIAYYQQLGKLHRLDGEQSVDVVGEQLRQVLAA
jgi:adenylate kinase